MTQLLRRDVEATLSRLPSLRRIQLAETLDLDKTRKTLLTGGEALVFWFSEFLFRYSPLTTDQQNFAVDHVLPALIVCGNDIAAKIEEKAADFPDYQFGVADRQCVTMTGFAGFVNLRDGSRLDALTHAPTELTTYNLTRLMVGFVEGLERRRSKDATILSDPTQ